ncbi:MAG: PhaM family polyhydroxyalkanoate granule multifunctional regulatory protein [Burkholderiaceae bacterium]|jgi:conjugal transfer/entry exclusion protein
MQNPSDPFAFLSAWPGFSSGGLGQMPSAAMPTMDIDELDKRIADLKAVDQWLSLNLQLLKTTIQGMEVQRGTLAQLKAMQSSMQGPAEDAGHQAGALWANLQNQFNQMVAAAQASTASDSKASTAAAKPAKATKARAGETSRAKKTSSSRASGSAKTPRPRSGPTGSSPP